MTSADPIAAYLASKNQSGSAAPSPTIPTAQSDDPIGTYLASKKSTDTGAPDPAQSAVKTSDPIGSYFQSKFGSNAAPSLSSRIDNPSAANQGPTLAEDPYGNDQPWWNRPITSYAHIPTYGWFRDNPNDAGPIEKGFEKFASGMLTPLNIGLMVATGGLGSLAEGAGMAAVESGLGAESIAALRAAGWTTEAIDGAATTLARQGWAKNVATEALKGLADPSIAQSTAQNLVRSLAPESAKTVMLATRTAAQMAHAKFTYDQIAGLAHGVPAVADAIKTGDTDKAIELGTEALLSGFMGVLSGRSLRDSVVNHGVVGYHPLDIDPLTGRPTLTPTQQMTGEHQAGIFKGVKTAEDFGKNTPFENLAGTPVDKAVRFYREAGGDVDILRERLKDWEEADWLRQDIKEKHLQPMRDAIAIADDSPEGLALENELKARYGVHWREKIDAGLVKESKSGSPVPEGFTRVYGDPEKGEWFTDVQQAKKSAGVKYKKDLHFQDIADDQLDGFPKVKKTDAISLPEELNSNAKIVGENTGAKNYAGQRVYEPNAEDETDFVTRGELNTKKPSHMQRREFDSAFDAMMAKDEEGNSLNLDLKNEGAIAAYKDYVRKHYAALGVKAAQDKGQALVDAADARKIVVDYKDKRKVFDKKLYVERPDLTAKVPEAVQSKREAAANPEPLARTPSGNPEGDLLPAKRDAEEGATHENGINLHFNFPPDPKTASGLQAAATDPALAELMGKLGVKKIVVDPPHSFSLSQQGGVRNDTVRISPNAVDPHSTIYHEIGHFAYEGMTKEQQSAAHKLVAKHIAHLEKNHPGYAQMAKEGQFDEAFVSLLQERNPEALKLAGEVSSERVQNTIDSGRFAPEETAAEPRPPHRDWNDARENGGSITSRDNLAQMVKEHGDAMLVFKDVNGGRHLVPASLAARLMDDPGFAGHIREVHIVQDRSPYFNSLEHREDIARQLDARQRQSGINKKGPPQLGDAEILDAYEKKIKEKRAEEKRMPLPAIMQPRFADTMVDLPQMKAGLARVLQQIEAGTKPKPALAGKSDVAPEHREYAEAADKAEAEYAARAAAAIKAYQDAGKTPEALKILRAEKQSAVEAKAATLAEANAKLLAAKPEMAAKPKVKTPIERLAENGNDRTETSDDRPVDQTTEGPRPEQEEAPPIRFKDENGFIHEDGKVYQPIHDYVEGPRAFNENKVEMRTPVGQEDSVPIAERTPALIHPKHAADVMRSFEDHSLIRDNVVGRAALWASGKAKQSLLSISPFHAQTIFLRGVQKGFKPGEIWNPPEIDSPNAPIRDNPSVGGVKTGLVLSGAGEYSKAAEGSAESLPAYQKVPGIGPALKAFSDASNRMFEVWIPRLKAMTWKKTVAGLREQHPDWSDQQVWKTASDEANATFGGINWRQLGISKTWQDSLRLLMLAPDFTGSHILLGKTALEGGGSVVSQGLMRIAAYNMLAAQATNLLVSHKLHLDHPFGVVSPDEKKVYSVRTMPADIFHLMSDPRGFAANRMNPLTVRTAVEFATGKNDQGKMVDGQQQMLDLFRNVIPMSAQNFVGMAVPGITRGQKPSLTEAIARVPGLSISNDATRAERLAGQFASSHAQDGPVDPDRLAKHQAAIQFEEELAAKTKTTEDLNKAVEAGQFAPADAKAIITAVKTAANVPPQFMQLYLRANKLPMKNLLAVWDSATPTEQRVLAPILQKKVPAYFRTVQTKMTPAEIKNDPVFTQLRARWPGVPIF